MMRARLPCHEFFCSGALALQGDLADDDGPGPDCPLFELELTVPASSTESNTTAAVESVTLVMGSIQWP